jgi:hypothetical protein
LVPGRILKLFCAFTKPPKEKYIVLAATNPVLLGFVVNSELTSLQAKHPHLQEELVSMHANQGYLFLTNALPSYLDCTQAIDLDENDVIAQVVENPGRDLKMINATTREQVLKVMVNSLTLDGGTAKLIIKNLSPVI